MTRNLSPHLWIKLAAKFLSGFRHWDSLHGQRWTSILRVSGLLAISVCIRGRVPCFARKSRRPDPCETVLRRRYALPLHFIRHSASSNDRKNSAYANYRLGI